ncbi:MAG: hypothetical protein IID44_26440 [Planctomycetes bacterium]|nr:hypothetical protein [Planctomycetota bacterium]
MPRREDLEKLIEQIDACRPGSDDVHAPQLAELRPLQQRLEHDAEARELYDRIQSFDTHIAAAVREVRLEDFPQTAGLEQRLLAAVARADPAGDAPISEPASDGPPVRRSSRRGALAWMSGLAATAACVGIAYYLLPPPETKFRPTPSWVHETALDFYLAETDVPPGKTTSPPESHPMSGDVVRFAGTRWREVGDFLREDRAVAYEISAPGGNPVATLYVVKLSVPTLPTRPPVKAKLQTGGVCLSAWQSGDFVYVLVVPGGEEAYRQFLTTLERELA